MVFDILTQRMKCPFGLKSGHVEGLRSYQLPFLGSCGLSHILRSPALKDNAGEQHTMSAFRK
jgi:hypothetical protein